jgi:hypothetical protein
VWIDLLIGFFKGKGKAVPVVFLTQHHAMKRIGGVEV